MFRKKLAAPTVETCPHRCQVRDEDGEEAATCSLLKEVFGCRDDQWSQVRRDACDACCQSFPPSSRNLNPVVASLAYESASQIVQLAPAKCDLDHIGKVARDVLRKLHLDQPDDNAPPVVQQGSGRSLDRIVPRPARRYGTRVRQWAVGVQTSPRRETTLESCLKSLARAGWDSPYLFVDSAVQIPEQFSHLPGTFRDEAVGAWPNYYLALAELMMRRPYADAYMIVQDDVVLFDRESLREYLERALWPSRLPALVSLYCYTYDTQPDAGWHRRRRTWPAGPLAMVFSPPLAKAFVQDETVFSHRWDADPDRAVRVVDVIARWVGACRLDVWFPSPSLIQHIGETSTVWDAGRSTAARRAGWFAGDSETGG